MLSRFKQQLSENGLDIVHAFPLDPLDTDSLGIRALLSPLGRARTGLMIGNTRALWDHFLGWLEETPDWPSRDNPLDDYVMEAITRAATEHLRDARLFWTHETNAYLLPVQRLCHQCGLAHLSRGRFSVHPEYGPWFGMRALVVLADDLHTTLSPAVDPSSPELEDQVADHFKSLRDRVSGGLSSSHIRTSWEDWLALRDRYEVGRAYRYCGSQIRYHYTKDKSVLSDALARRG
jgi:hypothetical protein